MTGTEKQVSEPIYLLLETNEEKARVLVYGTQFVLFLAFLLNFYTGRPEMSVALVVTILMLGTNQFAASRGRPWPIRSYAIFGILSLACLFHAATGYLPALQWNFLVTVGSYMLMCRNGALALSVFNILAGGAVMLRVDAIDQALPYLAPMTLVSMFMYVAAGLAYDFKRTALTLSHTDLLSGLLNRHALDDMLQREAPKGAGAMVIVDIDRFKRINDTRGHLQGDAVLRRVSQALRDTLPEQPHLYRIGGDEFLLILPASDDSPLQSLCEQLCEAVRQVGGDDPLTISIGAGRFDWSEGFDTAFERVDRALMAAKAAGGDRAVLAPGETTS